MFCGFGYKQQLACGRSSASSTMLRSSSSTVPCSSSAFSSLQCGQTIREISGRQSWTGEYPAADGAAPTSAIRPLWAGGSVPGSVPGSIHSLRSLDNVQECAEQADCELLPVWQVEDEKRALDLQHGRPCKVALAGMYGTTDATSLHGLTSSRRQLACVQQGRGLLCS